MIGEEREALPQPRRRSERSWDELASPPILPDASSGAGASPSAGPAAHPLPHSTHPKDRRARKSRKSGSGQPRTAGDAARRKHLPPRRVILVYNAASAFDGKVMRGVADYVRQRPGWRIFLHADPLARQHLPDIAEWPADGIISNFDDPRVSTEVMASGLPVVGFGGGYGGYRPESSVPYVLPDNSLIGRMGADHLLERGFRHLAFCGYPPDQVNGWSHERATAFAHRATEAGATVDTFFGKESCSFSWSALQREIADWVGSLPRPVGIMASNDCRARHVVETCLSCGVPVPEQVAIIGVDNDELLCELSHPALSSVDNSARRVGHEAAALLDRVMSGHHPPARRTVVAPDGIVRRHSSDIVALADDLAAKAMSLVRNHACASIKISEIAQTLNVSRSTLQNRFKVAVGHTLHDEIRRVRVECTTRLLVESETPIKQIAAQCGFLTVQHLTAVFKHITGSTPAAFRRKARGSRGRSP